MQMMIRSAAITATYRHTSSNWFSRTFRDHVLLLYQHFC